MKTKLEFDLSFEFEYKGMMAQIRKIDEELSELKEAVLDKKYSHIINNGQIASEAFDVIEACFTLLKNECWFDDIQNAYIEHRNKLQERMVNNLEKK